MMKTICEPECQSVAKTFIEKCHGVPDMEESAEGLDMMLTMCADPCMAYMMSAGDTCFPDDGKEDEDDHDDHDGHDHDDHDGHAPAPPTAPPKNRRLLKLTTPVSSRR